MAELRPIDPDNILATVPATITAVKGLQSMLEGLAKQEPGNPIPTGDPEEMAKAYLEAEKEKYVDEAKMAKGLRGAGMDVDAADQIAHFLGSTMDKFWKDFF